MIRIVTAIALVLLPTAAPAQQRETFKDGRTLGWSTSNGSGGTSYYDSSARNTGRSITGSNGSTTNYDASGRITGRSTISNGTTMFYDASGRRVGTTATSKGR